MERQDIYTRVTEAIVAQLEAGTRPWAPRWDKSAGGFQSMPLRATGEAYRGVNVMLLWGAAQAQGFTEPRWLTFKQAQAEGAHVRKGERGSPVVFAGRIVREGEAQDNGETGEEVIPFMRGYTVFNVQQIDGLGAEWFSPPRAPRPEPERNASADAFFAGVGAEVRHGGGSAHFNPASDHIQMPALADFVSADAYYATLAHETVHWSGHKDRLARVFGKRFGDQAYAAEELVAEIGAAFVCASLEVSAEPREDHAAYLASWLKVLKGDKRAIFTAASAAQAACDFLHQRAAPAFRVAA